MKIKFNLTALRDVVCLFLLVFGTDTFVVFANTNELIKKFFQLLIILMACDLWFKWFGKKNRRYSCYLFPLLILLVLASMVFNSDFGNGNIYKIILLFFGVGYAAHNDFNVFALKFIKIMNFVAFFSIVTLILSPIIVQIGFIPVVSNGYISVKSLFFSNCCLDFSTMRNYGPFWEPGVYAIYLNFALFLSLKIQKKVSYSQLIIILAIVTTFSTTGIILLGIVFVSFFASSSGYNKTLRRVGIVLVTCVAIGAVFLNEGWYELIFSKLDNSTYAYKHSTMSRLNSIVTNWKIMIDNPLFGVGASNLTEYYNQYTMETLGYQVSNTNGLLINFSMYGLLFGIVYLWGYVKFSIKLGCGVIEKICVLAFFLIALLSEPLTTSIMFNTLPFWGLLTVPKGSKPKCLGLERKK